MMERKYIQKVFSNQLKFLEEYNETLHDKELDFKVIIAVSPNQMLLVRREPGSYGYRHGLMEISLHVDGQPVYNTQWDSTVKGYMNEHDVARYWLHFHKNALPSWC